LRQERSIRETTVVKTAQVRNKRPRAGGRLLALPVLLLSAVAIVVLALVGYVLWPRWPAPPTGPDAPALPIVVAGTTFNVPPAAIRMPVQRHAGTQERIDLAVLWPSLAAPDPTAKAVGDRLFLTIAVATASVAPAERLKSIYPRYTEPAAASRDGLAEYAFRDGTPYQGEDLVVDAAAPEHFAARCSRATGPRTPGMCLHDRRMGGVDITVRFPRDWLEQWRELADGIDRLIGGLRGASEGPAR
jgi:hypothetical protein